MKVLIIILLATFTNLVAANVLIPKCDLKKNINNYVGLSERDLFEKASISVHRRDHCDAANSFLEIYERGVVNFSKQQIIENLFYSLKQGHFLNEYTGLLFGLKNEMRYMNHEKINEDLVLLYSLFLSSEATNPLSQFQVGKKRLHFFDEAEMSFRFFLLNFPLNKSAQKIKKSLRIVTDLKLKSTIDYIQFYRQDVGLSGDLLSEELRNLISLLVRSGDSKYFKQGMNLLMEKIRRSSLPDLFQKQVNLIAENFLYGAHSAEETAKDLKLIISQNKSEISLFPKSNTSDLSSFLEAKGEDRSVFLPLNKDFKLTATKTLIGLGVVGILMTFDEPIMDFIQRNNEAGVMQGIAKYGNHFGEVSGLAPVILGTFGYGLVFNNNNSKNAAVSAIGSILLGQLMVETLKSATHRSRPEAGQGPFDFGGFGLGSDNTSFPSGHSAAAWSVASVFAEEFGDKYKWAPAAAYGLAALTSYARMHYNKHWASDVVVGAMVGYVAGKLFHKFFRNTFKNNLENIALIPLIGNSTGFRIIISERVYADLKSWPLDLLYNYQKSIMSLTKTNIDELDSIYSEVYLH
jgi:membrane-associated phospholipid phosphatase